MISPPMVNLPERLASIWGMLSFLSNWDALRRDNGAADPVLGGDQPQRAGTAEARIFSPPKENLLAPIS
jgi:hypothetical protein